MAKFPIQKPTEDEIDNDNSVPIQPQTDSGIEDIPQHEIAMLAYSYWEARGGRDGSAEEDWYRAEDDLRQRRTKAQTSRDASGSR
jgi:hypothetical protein